LPPPGSLGLLATDIDETEISEERREALRYAIAIGKSGNYRFRKCECK
jgi:hypothetical protein